MEQRKRRYELRTTADVPLLCPPREEQHGRCTALYPAPEKTNKLYFDTRYELHDMYKNMVYEAEPA